MYRALWIQGGVIVTLNAAIVTAVVTLATPRSDGRGGHDREQVYWKLNTDADVGHIHIVGGEATRSPRYCGHAPRGKVARAAFGS